MVVTVVLLVEWIVGRSVDALAACWCKWLHRWIHCRKRKMTCSLARSLARSIDGSIG